MSEEKKDALTQLDERWNGFIKKVQDRYQEVIDQSDLALKDVIDGLQYDNIIIYNILNGLKFQTVDQLSEKVDQGWSKMQGELEKARASSAVISGHYKKGEDFKIKVADDFEVYSNTLMVKAANKILDNVKKHIGENRMHNCTQCGNELPINVYTFMALNIKCDSCGAINTYEPDSRVRCLESFVIGVMAEDCGFEDKRKGNMKEYYKKYYGYMMEHIPEKKENFERMMNERLKW